MSHVHTILHPNDLSETSAAAFRMACALARDFGADLVVLHIYPPPVDGAEAIDRDRDDDLENALLDQLHKLIPHDPNIHIGYRLVEGAPADVIVSEARGCDLIVMGTHGRGGLSRAIMGSVAEHVLREAPCPVVTVRPSVPVPEEAVPLGQNSLNSGM